MGDGALFWFTPKAPAQKTQSSISYGPKTELRRSGSMADPETPETPIHTDAEHVRAGETTGVMRYVLGISLLLAVLILSLLVWGPVLLSGK